MLHSWAMTQVFISYSHDSEAHKQGVLDLADRLRADDVTVIIDSDMLPGGPPNGWPAWSEAQVRNADRVLVACTENYRRRYDLEEVPGTGLGVVCEAGAIRQLLYDTGGLNEKFRVTLFAAEDNNQVPLQLSRYHRFLLYAENGYKELLAWLQGAESVTAPSAPPPQTIPWPQPAPDYPWQLADRKPEFAHFEKMVTGQLPQRILLLRGLSNTGKTVLSAELLAYARHLHVTAACVDFKGCPSLDDLFQTLLLDLGPELLRHAHTASGTARFYHLISDFQQIRTPLLLVFDTYEQASVDAQNWLESQLLPRIERAPAVVVLVCGQEIPEYTKYTWRGLSEAHELQPIEEAGDWLEYSQRKWQSQHLKTAHVEALTLAAGGNPGQVSALLESLMMQLQANPDG